MAHCVITKALSARMAPRRASNQPNCVHPSSHHRVCPSTPARVAPLGATANAHPPARAPACRTSSSAHARPSRGQRAPTGPGEGTHEPLSSCAPFFDIWSLAGQSIRVPDVERSHRAVAAAGEVGSARGTALRAVEAVGWAPWVLVPRASQVRHRAIGRVATLRVCGRQTSPSRTRNDTRVRECTGARARVRRWLGHATRPATGQ